MDATKKLALCFIVIVGLVKSEAITRFSNDKEVQEAQEFLCHKCGGVKTYIVDVTNGHQCNYPGCSVIQLMSYCNDPPTCFRIEAMDGTLEGRFSGKKFENKVLTT